MTYSNGKMQPNTTASAKARSKTAGPGGSFPIGDAVHARLAIGAATRSENAGHIGAATAASIKAKAKSALAKDDAGKSGRLANLGAHAYTGHGGSKCPTCGRPR